MCLYAMKPKRVRLEFNLLTTSSTAQGRGPAEPSSPRGEKELNYGKWRLKTALRVKALTLIAKKNTLKLLVSSDLFNSALLHAHEAALIKIIFAINMRPNHRPPVS